MKLYLYLPAALIMISSCSSDTKSKSAWLGEWDAKWETDPTSFEGIEGITDFTMNGKITFDEHQVNIKAYGFEGCAFGVDTLDHSLFWKVKGDTLMLINSEDTPGMDYRIEEMTEDKIKLQLLEDIFLTLEKKS